MKRLSNTGFSAVEVLLLVVVFAGIAGSGVYVATKQKSAKPLSSPTNSQNVPATNETAVVTKKYTVQNFDTFVNFDAPADWKVSRSPAELSADVADKILEEFSISSPDGLSLSVSPNPGVGGYCEPNNDPFTLLGSVNSSQNNVRFTEYSDGKTNELFRNGFGIDNSNELFDMKVGDTRTDTCKLGYHAFGYGSSRVKIAKNGQPTTYKEVSANPDFVKMLNSFAATDPTFGRN